MKRLIALAVISLLLASCGQVSRNIKPLHAYDYQWHKQTLYIKVHWNYQHPDKDTIVADGFVEPISLKYGVHDVALELVALDGDGEVVNSVSGRPADNYIASPLDTSPFRITMKLKGGEERFTIKGTYFFYIGGTTPDLDAKRFDNIPLVADEPL